ncbi:von Willebrand factor type A domain-containing protein [Primorskyibacter aestuariivivens]|uniref:vWA domain-containing protein n=1 Tax=Primorskyibacter aestuariivivens TaxID=1888912 RepID=UPI0022FFF7BE|nr:von Willebrand factor type A domain-containing protein [Primorskyibacter aestuariivivens]MDA7429943.1 von Willebrand factor type A domain-containing protein [Primorskyibacter aestuariivivens]
MSDEFDKLAQSLRAATPSPDETRKAANIAEAEKIFAASQGSRDSARQTLERPKRGVLMRGLDVMLKSLSPRAALGATTAIALVGVALILPTLEVGAPEVVRDVPKPVSSMDAPLEEALATPRQKSTGTATGGLMSMEPAPAPAPSADFEFEVMNVAPGGNNGTVRMYSGQPAAELGDVQMRAPLVDQFYAPESTSEAYPEAETNPLKVTVEDPVSTFSIDVDTAAWSVLRNMIEAGQLPAPETVRIEEMVNYFPYDYPAPGEGSAFRTGVTVADTPWNAHTRLVHIGIQGALPDVEDRPPLNLVFLVDVSGSMDDPRKLPLLKQSLRLMLGELRPEDEVAIVTYAGASGVALEPTRAGDRATILAALDGLGAGGGTAGQAGLQEAYALAEKMSEDGEVSRVLLATDGDFNIGLHDPDALKEFIADKRETGTYLSVLGFGRGNLDDALMQALAQNGNGMAAYIDTLSEAQKVLVDQLTGALFPIADDVKIQVEFNPAQVAEYRLIGYETRALKREDFNNDKVDAGDIGAGHQVTAIYEVTPVGSPARLTDPLRYQATADAGSDELGFLRLRYKAPGAAESRLIETPIVEGSETTDDMRFAFAIAGFGQLLRGGEYTGQWDYGDAVALANGAKGGDPFGYRAEALRLMRLVGTMAE